MSNKPQHNASFQYINDKGNVWLIYGQYRGIVTVLITDAAGNVIDQWDGAILSLPVRFQQGA